MSRDAWTADVESWTIHLQARGRSAKTIATYLESVNKLARWARENDVASPTIARRSDLEKWLVSIRESGVKDTTVLLHYRQARVFYMWLWKVEELDDSANPYRKLERPTIGKRVRPVPRDEDVRKLLAACKGRTFVARRDLAIVRLLADTGIRRNECANLKVADLDLARCRMLVDGKGSRERVVAFGAKTAEVLDAYLRARGRHKDAGLAALWLAGDPHRGALGYNGIRLVLSRRCKLAGIAAITPHELRHSAVGAAFEAGMQEHEAMSLFGWKSDVMPKHYAEATRDRRALETADRLRPGDRL